MTIKLTALATSACAAVLCVLSTLYPSDPYFFVISSYLAVVIGRLILCALMVNLAFTDKFKYVISAKVCLAAGALAFAFGVAGIVVMPLSYSLFTFFKPLDYVFFMEVGLMFSLAAISYQPGSYRLPRLSRPRNAQLRLRFKYDS